MSTIHTISKEKQIPYTVVGGQKQTQASGSPLQLTILLLNRGGRFYREELLKTISGLDFTELIYIEGPELTYDIEPLSRQFPNVRFLLLKDDTSPGEKINIGMEESHAEQIFVMWSDMKLSQAVIPGPVLKKAAESNSLCTVPLCRNSRKELIPIIQVPGYIKRKLKIIPWKSEKEGARSIFPFDFCGIYHKRKFQSLGGFDTMIQNPYWQKMDFGFRAGLWGEKILLNPAYTVSYAMDNDTEDNTPDASYKWFYLKNLAVNHSKNKGCLKFYKFLRFYLYSNTGLLQSLGEFMAVKTWVKQHSEKFKLDLKTIINLWEPPEA